VATIAPLALGGIAAIEEDGGCPRKRRPVRDRPTAPVDCPP